MRDIINYNYIFKFIFRLLVVTLLVLELGLSPLLALSPTSWFSGADAPKSHTDSSVALMGKVYDNNGNWVIDGITIEVREHVETQSSTVTLVKNGQTLQTADGQDATFSWTEISSSVDLSLYLDQINQVLRNELHQNQFSETALSFIQWLGKWIEHKPVRVFSARSGIHGFADESHIYISKELFSSPVALFHELGESYFQQEKNFEPYRKAYTGLTAHTLLRGAGKDVRQTLHKFSGRTVLTNRQWLGVLEREIQKNVPGRKLSLSERALLKRNLERYRAGKLTLKMGQQMTNVLCYGWQDEIFGELNNLWPDNQQETRQEPSNGPLRPMPEGSVSLADLVSFLRAVATLPEERRVQYQARFGTFFEEMTSLQNAMSELKQSEDLQPADLMTDIFHQGSSRDHALTEIIFNAIDATLQKHGITALIGRFGDGAFQQFQELEDEGDEIIIETRAESGSTLVMRFRLNEPRNLDRFAEQVSVSFGTKKEFSYALQTETRVTVKKVNGLSPERQDVLRQRVQKQFAQNCQVPLLLNRRLVNDLEGWKDIHGQPLQTAVSSQSFVRVEIKNDGYMVIDRGPGMTPSTILETYLLPRHPSKDRPAGGQTHLAYLPRDMDRDEALTKTEVQLGVGGEVIETFELEGFPLPAGLRIDFPPGNWKPESKNKLAVNADLWQAVTGLMGQLFQNDNFENQLPLINALSGVLEHMSNLRYHPEAELLDVHPGRVLIEYLEQVPGLTPVPDFQGNGRRAYHMPLPASRVVLECGNCLILNTTVYERLRETPHLLNARLNPLVSDRVPAHQHGRFGRRRETEWRQSTRTAPAWMADSPWMPVLESFPDLHALPLPVKASLISRLHQDNTILALDEDARHEVMREKLTLIDRFRSRLNSDGGDFSEFMLSSTVISEHICLQNRDFNLTNPIPSTWVQGNLAYAVPEGQGGSAKVHVFIGRERISPPHGFKQVLSLKPAGDKVAMQVEGFDGKQYIYRNAERLSPEEGLVKVDHFTTQGDLVAYAGLHADRRWHVYCNQEDVTAEKEGFYSVETLTIFENKVFYYANVNLGGGYKPYPYSFYRSIGSSDRDIYQEYLKTNKLQTLLPFRLKTVGRWWLDIVQVGQSRSPDDTRGRPLNEFVLVWGDEGVINKERHYEEVGDAIEWQGRLIYSAMGKKQWYVFEYDPQYKKLRVISEGYQQITGLQKVADQVAFAGKKSIHFEVFRGQPGVKDNTWQWGTVGISHIQDQKGLQLQVSGNHLCWVDQTETGGYQLKIDGRKVSTHDYYNIVHQIQGDNSGIAVKGLRIGSGGILLEVLRLGEQTAHWDEVKAPLVLEGADNLKRNTATRAEVHRFWQNVLSQARGRHSLEESVSLYPVATAEVIQSLDSVSLTLWKEKYSSKNLKDQATAASFFTRSFHHASTPEQWNVWAREWMRFFDTDKSTAIHVLNDLSAFYSGRVGYAYLHKDTPLDELDAHLRDHIQILRGSGDNVFAAVEPDSSPEGEADKVLEHVPVASVCAVLRHRYSAMKEAKDLAQYKQLLDSLKDYNLSGIEKEIKSVIDSDIAPGQMHWVRELAQNARDIIMQSYRDSPDEVPPIVISSFLQDNHWVVRVEDPVGMSLATIVQFLLTLNHRSKGPQDVGQFGQGFFSLFASPEDEIKIQTGQGQTRYDLILGWVDGRLMIKSWQERKNNPYRGTRIERCRPISEENRTQRILEAAALSRAIYEMTGAVQDVPIQFKDERVNAEIRVLAESAVESLGTLTLALPSRRVARVTQHGFSVDAPGLWGELTEDLPDWIKHRLSPHWTVNLPDRAPIVRSRYGLAQKERSLQPLKSALTAAIMQTLLREYLFEGRPLAVISDDFYYTHHFDRNGQEAASLLNQGRGVEVNWQAVLNNVEAMEVMFAYMEVKLGGESEATLVLRLDDIRRRILLAEGLDQWQDNPDIHGEIKEEWRHAMDLVRRAREDRTAVAVMRNITPEQQMGSNTLQSFERLTRYVLTHLFPDTAERYQVRFFHQDSNTVAAYNPETRTIFWNVVRNRDLMTEWVQILKGEQTEFDEFFFRFVNILVHEISHQSSGRHHIDVKLYGGLAQIMQSYFDRLILSDGYNPARYIQEQRDNLPDRFDDITDIGVNGAEISLRGSSSFSNMPDLSHLSLLKAA